METKTVQYKRTLRGSVGAGMSALVNGNGRRYYILEHRDASKYHKAGESQKIIIDQIELGRDDNCQVRYDESFAIVSRRHAAITRDGDKWKLVQLSSTNSTYLNGRKIEKEWYLENGDEIQLATGGPRLGFIVPEGKQSLVSSIKMTERLNLFRQQALRPYKTAIAVLFAVLLALSAVGGYVIHKQDDKITVQGKTIVSQGRVIEKLTLDVEHQNSIFSLAQEQYKKDSLAWAKKIAEAKKNSKSTSTTVVHVVNPSAGKVQPSPNPTPHPNEFQKQLEKASSSVYAVITEVYIENSEERKLISKSQGSGFLLTDGKFVTARHCVEPWMYDDEDMQLAFALSNTFNGLEVYSVITAINSTGDVITAKSSQFKVDRSYDSPCSIPYEHEGETIKTNGSIAYGTTASLGNDWAYLKVNKNGNIKDGRAISASLKSGEDVHLLGFPMGLGIGTNSKGVDPVYNKLNISQTGLNNSRCIMVSSGVDHGNSGGPVFVYRNKSLEVIGIVSRGDNKSDHYNHLVPMSNLN